MVRSEPGNQEGVELQEGIEWPGACRPAGAVRRSSSQEGVERPGQLLSIKRAPFSRDRAKWPGGAEPPNFGYV